MHREMLRQRQVPSIMIYEKGDQGQPNSPTAKSLIPFAGFISFIPGVRGLSCKKPTGGRVRTDTSLEDTGF